MANFKKETFNLNYLGDKQPALAANFRMRFKDERLLNFLPSGTNLNDMAVLGYTAEIPASVLTVLMASYVGGFMTPIPGKIQPQGINLVFYENNAYTASKFFNNWKGRYVELYPEDPNSNVSTNSADYKIDLEIELLNNQRMVTTVVRLKDAFPFTIIYPDYTWSQADALPIVQVGLTFDYAEFENYSND